MRIAAVEEYDVNDIQVWSGTPYYIYQEFSRSGLKIDTWDKLAEKRIRPSLLGRCQIRLKKQLTTRLTGRAFMPIREAGMLKAYARYLHNSVRNTPVDALFSTSSLPFSYYESSTPTFFWTDATFGAMVDYYEEFTGLSPMTLRAGHAAEKAALKNCRCAIYASQWAADSAINQYGADPAKVAVIPFGANVNTTLTEEDIADRIRARPTSRCQLLAIGNDWVRKGFDDAIAVATRLNEAGLPTTLHLVGATTDRKLPAYVVQEGRVDKSTPEGRERFEKLLTTSHFLLVPSRAEAFGLGPGEAGAFGVPALVSSSGGLMTTVRNGINGYHFALEDYIDATSAIVEELIRKPEAYRELATGARQAYRERLNWRSATDSVRNLILERSA